MQDGWVVTKAVTHALIGIAVKEKLLDLNVWGERRLLPEGWVEHATTPTPGSDQKYGAHWGLNRGGRYPDIPRDAFYARGFGGQLVLVVPSRSTVIVRLGQTPGGGFDVNTFARSVLKAL